MNTHESNERKLERLALSDKKAISPEVVTILLALLEILNNFLTQWFLTPAGERKSFFKALLLFINGEFWKDVFNLRGKLDEVINKL